MNINRGDIFYAALDENPIGSEQTGIRSVVILQNNIGNMYDESFCDLMSGQENTVENDEEA